MSRLAVFCFWILIFTFNSAFADSLDFFLPGARMDQDYVEDLGGRSYSSGFDKESGLFDIDAYFQEIEEQEAEQQRLYEESLVESAEPDVVEGDLVVEDIDSADDLEGKSLAELLDIQEGLEGQNGELSEENLDLMGFSADTEVPDINVNVGDQDSEDGLDFQTSGLIAGGSALGLAVLSGGKALVSNVLGTVTDQRAQRLAAGIVADAAVGAAGATLEQKANLGAGQGASLIKGVATGNQQAIDGVVGSQFNRFSPSPRPLRPHSFPRPRVN